jgi:hypothetical protein
MSTAKQAVDCTVIMHRRARGFRLCFAQQPSRIGTDASRALLAAVHPTESGGRHHVVEGSEQ